MPSGGLLVVLSGPSGVGKGTVVKHAMFASSTQAKRLVRSVSVTTRPRRAGEQDGTDYFFVTQEEFSRMAVAGELLEWATYLDNSYGTPRQWLDQQLEAGYDVVLEIEVEGAMQVRERRPGAVLIYMLPPSWRALRQRLKRRRSEGEEIQRRRIEVAREEIKFVPSYDYLMINERVRKSARQLLAILEAERARVGRVDLSGLLRDSGE
jgi:guanylate kinase